MKSISDRVLFSIVTINKNNRDGLRRTLDSLDQIRDCADVDLVFVDGGSVDGSLEFARELYRADRIISEPDTGIYNAMNKGLKAARGRYVVWLNSGDQLLPSSYENLVSRLSSSQADVVAFGVLVANEPVAQSEQLMEASIDNLPHGTLPHPGACFLRSALLELGGYNEKYKIVGDRDLFIRLFKRSASFQVERLPIARFYSGGLSSTKECWRENLELSYTHGVISRTRYFSYRLKYILSFFPLVGRRLRLRAK